MPELVWGAYEDAMPEKWLIRHGRGLYGPPHSAGREHRGDLVAFFREHYGTIGWHPWKRRRIRWTCAVDLRDPDPIAVGGRSPRLQRQVR